MTTLILIRHGSTEWNREKKYCGSTDIPLSAGGKKDIRLLRKKLSKFNIERIYTSDRLRAKESAALLFPKRRAQQITDLREVSFGKFEGFTYRQIMARYPLIYKRWLSRPYATDIPGGESMARFENRVCRALEKLVKYNKNKTFAVVCHGGTISVYLNRVFGTRDFWKHIPHPASMSVVIFKKSAGPKIIIFDNRKGRS